MSCYGSLLQSKPGACFKNKFPFNFQALNISSKVRLKSENFTNPHWLQKVFLTVLNKLKVISERGVILFFFPFPEH